MNEKQRKAALEAFMRGGGRAIAAEAAGVTVPALEAEVAGDFRFEEQVEAAQDYAVEKAILTIFEAAHEGSVTAAKFVAERRRPEDWTVPSDPAIALHVSPLDIDIETLHRKLEARSPLGEIGGGDD